MWILIILNSYFVIKVIARMREKAMDESYFYISRTTSNLKWYPIILIICFIPATIHRIMDITVKVEVKFLLYVQGIFDSLQGLLFVIVYSLTPEVQLALKELWKKSCRKTGLSSYNGESISSMSSSESVKLKSDKNTLLNGGNINESKANLL